MQSRKKKFDLLFLEHSGRVLRYAINRGLSLEEAEDVVADTFLVCWRRFDDLPGDPLPWLLGIAHRTIANHRRSSHRQDALKRRLAAEAGVAAAPAEDAAGPDGYELKQALRLLSEKDREVILLTAVDGLSGAEAAGSWDAVDPRSLCVSLGQDQDCGAYRGHACVHLANVSRAGDE